MHRRLKALWYNMTHMKLNKDGSKDKRFKENKEVVEIDATEAKKEEVVVKTEPTHEFFVGTVDANDLHQELLKDNNLKLDFDVLEGTITTKHGIIKLDKPTLVIKASYVTS